MGKIEQTIEFSATPEDVFRALTDGDTFAKVTGAPASADARAGGAFALFGEQIVGRNVELAAGRRVVQAWRAINWPEGAYSLVTFSMEPHANGTQLSMTQIGHPDDQAEHLAGGWHSNYWDNMKKFFG